MRRPILVLALCLLVAACVPQTARTQSGDGGMDSLVSRDALVGVWQNAKGAHFLSGCGRRARSAGSDGAFRPELVSAGRCSDLAHSRYPGRSAVGGKIGRDARRSLPPGTARAGRDRPDLAQKPGRGGPSERHGNLSGAYGSASLGGGRRPAVFTRFGRARGFVSGRGVRSGRVALPRILFGQRYGGGRRSVAARDRFLRNRESVRHAVAGDGAARPDSRGAVAADHARRRRTGCPWPCPLSFAARPGARTAR